MGEIWGRIKNLNYPNFNKNFAILAGFMGNLVVSGDISAPPLIGKFKGFFRKIQHIREGEMIDSD